MSNTSSFLRQNPAGNTLFLLDRARAGSERAWRELYHRYRTMLVVHIECRMSDSARRGVDIEDVLQRAYTKAWRYLDTFVYQGEGSFRRWLATLVIHEFRNELRSQEVEHARLLIDDHSEEGDTLALPDESCNEPGEVLANRSLLTLMGKLEEQDRDVLTMRIFEDMSFEALGEVLGCSKGHARMLFDRALGRLQRLMT